jgi:hypothetical protein
MLTFLIANGLYVSYFYGPNFYFRLLALLILKGRTAGAAKLDLIGAGLGPAI